MRGAATITLRSRAFQFIEKQKLGSGAIVKVSAQVEIRILDNTGGFLFEVTLYAVHHIIIYR